jgi:non-heme chloroperoxidase
MHRLSVLGLTLALVAWRISIVSTHQPAAGEWRDLSRHEVRFVTVDRGVQLELLDWGGSGQPVVLLTGSGHTAHVYDAFAPKLTDCCHVYGITRRGFGVSTRPESGYDDQRLADDVFRAIEVVNIQKPVLIGHSMAGGEMTTVGRQHSDRLAGLVYLDAIADLEDDPPADKEWVALQQKMPPDLRPRPACPPMDRTSFPAYQKSLACSFGFTFPESELRNQFDDVNGAVGQPTAPDWMMRSIGQQQVYRKDYSNVGVPLLFLMELPRFPEEYHPKSEEDRALIEQFVARGQVIVNRWIDKAKRNVRDVRVVDVPGGGHYLWITRETQVLREVHAFIASLPHQAHEQ